MKILLITHEEWNDYTYSNGILTNWFSGFNADFAQIYLSPGLPNNNICHKYFQISDLQMVKSILKKEKLDVRFQYLNYKKILNKPKMMHRE